MSHSHNELQAQREAIRRKLRDILPSSAEAQDLEEQLQMVEARLQEVGTEQTPALSSEDATSMDTQQSLSETRFAGRDSFGDVEGNVYTGTVIVQRDGREIRLPLQLPPRAEKFVNRKKELERLLQDLQPGQVVTLC